MRSPLADRLQPPALPAGAVLVLTFAFIAGTLTRGVDWLVDREPGTISAVMLDNGVGLVAWGAALVVGAVGLIGAYASRRHLLVWCAHVYLVSVYFGIGVTTLQSVIAFGGGWQHLVVPVGAVTWHASLSRIMRPFAPRRRATVDAD